MPFTARQLHPAFAHQGVITHRQFGDEVVSPRPLGRQDDLVARRAGPRISDVFPNPTMEQRRILRHHGDGAPQATLGDVAHILAIDQDAALLHVVEPLQQLHERRLARSRGPDQGYPLARCDHQTEVLIERVGLRLIAEGHVVKHDLAQLAPKRRCPRRVAKLWLSAHIGRHVQGIVQPLLQHPGDLREVAHIARHDDERGDSKGHVPGIGVALGPGQHQHPGQTGLQQH